VKIRICTPCLSGSTAAAFTRSMIETAQALTLADISLQWSVLSFANFIQCARNEMVAEFLGSDCTDLVFIDDDMGWDTGGFLKMLTRQVDVIGAICPRRRDPREWNVNLLSDERGSRIEIDGMLECSYIGTALLRIRRCALEQMPRPFNAGYEGERFIGEDAWFCREYRRAGGRIWAEPNITITHTGPHEWRGNYAEENYAHP
jgi:hypothetical protein